MGTPSTTFLSRTRRKSFTVSGFLPRLLSQISTPLAILASSTSQTTTQSTSGLRKKHSRSPCPMPPQPMRPSRTLSLGPGSAARTERTKGAVRLLTASGATLVANADLPRNLRREICVIIQAFDGITDRTIHYQDQAKLPRRLAPVELNQLVNRNRSAAAGGARTFLSAA